MFIVWVCFRIFTMSPLLQQKLDSLTDKKLSNKEIRDQRINFAYGNVPEGCESITIKTVRNTEKKLYNS